MILSLPTKRKTKDTDYPVRIRGIHKRNAESKAAA